MKIAIIGPGALGTLFAGLLVRAEQEVWLIDHKPARAREIQRNGLKIVGNSRLTVDDSRFRVTVKPKEIGVPDLVIVLVKVYDTLNAVKKIKPVVGKNTLVLSLQNGLGNLELLATEFGKEKVLGGTTAMGAMLLAPGKVRHAGVGKTIIGSICVGVDLSTRLNEIVRVFNQSKIPTQITQDLESTIWSKLVLNSAVNPLAVITRERNGKLIKDKWLRYLLCGTVQESYRVARAKKIKLAYSDPQKKVIEICRATATNVNSMLQDILSHRKTEIDYINGAIVKEAKKLGVFAPINAILWQLVKSVNK